MSGLEFLQGVGLEFLQGMVALATTNPFENDDGDAQVCFEGGISVSTFI